MPKSVEIFACGRIGSAGVTDCQILAVAGALDLEAESPAVAVIGQHLARDPP